MTAADVDQGVNELAGLPAANNTFSPLSGPTGAALVQVRRTTH